MKKSHYTTLTLIKILCLGGLVHAEEKGDSFDDTVNELEEQYYQKFTALQNLMQRLKNVTNQEEKNLRAQIRKLQQELPELWDKLEQAEKLRQERKENNVIQGPELEAVAGDLKQESSTR